MFLFITKVLIIWFIAKQCPVICHEETIEDNNNEEPKRKLNVVLFFTHVDLKNFSLNQDSLRSLNFDQKSRVKHDTLELTAKPDHKEGSAYCKDYLKNSLLALTKYCHTVMKMKTAIASVSSKEMTNDIQEPEGPYHIPKIHMDEPRSKRSEANANESKRKGGVGIITGANRHTEIFEIRLKKRDAKEEEPKQVEIVVEGEVPEKTSTAKSWDVLDVMKHVRYSFLGNMLKDTLKNDMKADQDDFADIEHIGKQKEDAGLFSMVKSTLEVLNSPPESPFLLVIFGGHLSALTNKQSPIFNSIKHVVEMTDMNNTLIAVTECKLLYDIPLTVRKILEVECGGGVQLEIETQET
ncbi:uncharacterized protein LOC126746005 isoform X2 [Anthonomus grandis grandis]|uniref:uncharacterized protein LOC126746005 isoform X2 n=1 Tax=Anthonomus grandis grandis TaxID=2921223 RepID=UPI0021655852|nr:uncharacterized protein LOC126746005 isoform X2 [Anthonomus grandis grandis]